MKDILYKELCYDIVGICFKVQGQLGRFCKEKHGQFSSGVRGAGRGAGAPQTYDHGRCARLGPA